MIPARREREADRATTGPDGADRAPLRIYAVFDAARDYTRLALARIRSGGSAASLFEGAKGEELEDVAPHIVYSDALGQTAELVVAPDQDGEFGILITPAPGDAGEFSRTRRHLRRFLMVRRSSDSQRVFFRFYDPRVLRAFLPACSADELRRFFGPVLAFHCQSDDQGRVLTFKLDGPAGTTRLVVDETPWEDFLNDTFPARRDLKAHLARQAPTQAV